MVSLNLTFRKMRIKLSGSSLSTKTTNKFKMPEKEAISKMNITSSSTSPAIRRICLLPLAGYHPTMYARALLFGGIVYCILILNIQYVNIVFLPKYV